MFAQLAVAATLFASAGALFYVFLGGLVWGSGYMPTPRKDTARALELSPIRDGMKVYDLGSGFGGVVLAVAQEAAVRCVGVEIDPLKCWWSSMMIERRHLGARAMIRQGNLFDTDLSDADAVFVFLMPGIMEKLKGKLQREMRPGSTVISYWHRFADWKPWITDDRHHVFIYRIQPDPNHAQPTAVPQDAA